MPKKEGKNYNQMTSSEKRDYNIANASLDSVFVYSILTIIGIGITFHLITAAPINAWLIIVSAIVTISFIVLIFESLTYCILQFRRKDC